MAGDPEWRFDASTGRRVLISPNRGERPLHIGRICPFCEGHESETPNEVLVFSDVERAENAPGWRVRVVPNRYAALRLDLGKGEVGAARAQNPSPQPPPRSGEGEKEDATAMRRSTRSRTASIAAACRGSSTHMRIRRRSPTTSGVVESRARRKAESAAASRFLA